MGISLVPPQQPQDKVHMRVHTLDQTCCRLLIKLDSTAKEIVKEACQKLDLREFKYELGEVKSTGMMVKINPQDVSVHSGMSVNGRLYVMPKKYSEKTVVCTTWGGAVFWL
jgi:hypothetical protein